MGIDVVLLAAPGTPAGRFEAIGAASNGCVYCGASGRLTLDHVVPRSRGGDSVWENVVTSCAPCNLRKGNRLPHEIEMPLRKPPRAPAPVLFIHLATPKVPDGWQPYLAGLSDEAATATA